MEKELAKNFKLNKNSPVPLYFQLKTQLQELLKNKYYQPGDKLPTEAEFCALLNISRPTVRQAFQELISEGYITRYKAKGSFVSKPKVEGFFFQKLESYQEEMESLGLVPSTRVILAEVIEKDSVCKSIFQDKDSRMFHLLRLRYANDDEMVLVHTYVPYARFEGIEYEDFKTESLYSIFKRKYHCEIKYVDRDVEAKQASGYEKELLAIDEQSAILYVTTVAYAMDDEPVEYSIAYYRGDRNKFRMRLDRK